MYFLLKVWRCNKSVICLIIIKPRRYSEAFLLSNYFLNPTSYPHFPQKRLYPRSISRTIIREPIKTFSISSPIIIPTPIQNIIKPRTFIIGPPEIIILVYYMQIYRYYTTPESYPLWLRQLPHRLHPSSLKKSKKSYPPCQAPCQVSLL